ncbi:putative RNA methyltransferase [Zafaria sp. J156]|uniref:putative RNA methyltransferase n=1 Tax=Zafaria sp. J156 TaxID=3116490 RepID=UPI002E75DA48|nr:SAM-dependent methyltransferase [Zafaria sp. J156]MEE1621196.1 SAM-dependent methyltransferase [Zafaria sp. J156]
MTPDHRSGIELLCPLCARPLASTGAAGRSLACGGGHRFDAAKQGYVNLLTGRGTGFTEDTADMVAARAGFLAAGHYAPLARALAGEALRAAGRLDPERAVRVLDAGAGTGYYLGAVLSALRSGTQDGDAAEARAGSGPSLAAPAGHDAGARPGSGPSPAELVRDGDDPAAQAGRPASGVALDISRYAMRRAARLEGVRALVWDVWRRLPLPDGGADLLLNVFAPRNGAEFHRVLADDGTLLVVTPLPGHLREAAEPLGLLGIAPDKEASVAGGLGPGWTQTGVREVRFTLRLDEADAARLALMGPAGHHADAAVFAERAAHGVPESVTAAFRLQAFAKDAGSQHRPQG